MFNCQCVCFWSCYTLWLEKNEWEMSLFYTFGCWLFLCFCFMCTNVFKFTSATSGLYGVWTHKTQENMSATTKPGFNSKLEAWTVLFPVEKNVSQVGNGGETSCQYLLHSFKMFLDWDLDEEIKFEHIYILWTWI